MPKNYTLTKTDTRSYYTQTCTVSGCTISNSGTSALAYHEARLTSTSTNNKRDRKIWRNYNLEKVVAYGPISERRYFAKYSWQEWNPLIGAYQTRYAPYTNKVEVWRMSYGTNWAKPTSRCLAGADAIAQAKLLSRLKDRRTHWESAAVTLGEARETAQHMAKTAKRLFFGYKALRRGDLGEVHRQLLGRPDPPRNKRGLASDASRKSKSPSWKDDVSSAWMEYSYAWVPLLGEIDSAARYWAEKRVGRTLTRFDVTAKHELTDNWRGTSQNSISLIPEYVRETAHVRYSYEIEPDWARNASTLDELGFTDPLSVAWELLPLSFVVDWFVNVGQVLSSLAEFRRWTVVRGLKSSGQTFFRYMPGSVGSSQSGGFTTVSWNSGDAYLRHRTVARTVLSNLPTSVPLKVNVSNPFDLRTGQLASAVILLRYAFR